MTACGMEPPSPTLSQAARLADALPGGLDRLRLLLRDLEHGLRQAARDELVRVVLAHLPAIGALDLGVARRRRHAEDLVCLVEAVLARRPGAPARAARGAVGACVGLEAQDRLEVRELQ